jgi:hypothetical protein
MRQPELYRELFHHEMVKVPTLCHPAGEPVNAGADGFKRGRTSMSQNTALAPKPGKWMPAE